MRMNTLIKNLVFPDGLRPRTIRGGRLKGLRFGVDLRNTTQLWRGTYERCLQDWLASNVREGATCLDIGAAEGYFTLWMAKLAGATGTVLAFEPGPESPQIRANFELNPTVPLAKLEVFELFVSAESGEKSVSIDRLAETRGMTSIDVVKVDVEGAEVKVLEGMREVLQRYHPRLFIEVHSQELLDQVKEITAKLGYQMKLELPPAHEYRLINFNAFYYSV
jgi:hypothetical protein